MRALVLGMLALLVSACTGIPQGHQVVRPFYLDRYLGTWYEIARLDHGFERGLNRVTATYSLRDDGGVRVINRGQEPDGNWREAEGRAYFLGAKDEGRLKVSFFGPFYGSYNVLATDYELALVSSYNLQYLWILSRTPEPPDAGVQALIARARALGFDTNALIRVSQR
ncbi:lipocalin [Aeromonas taiwanensis]|uniref:Outer membrane lipoprotein Blc n=1 Tax=Aeromonas taiwanensis TaxID=633417 RepID=A0A5F0KGK0_9GAMM|nr:lipocalin family protein [Aeromonas taiwanensis]TFF81321.1 lipocalin [Aeromonas taiwanensis]TFF82265.1 lipocalin [Aeromonas taiwanensis]TFF83576.1 lipocalin [Aeromonas taiwanensis]